MKYDLEERTFKFARDVRFMIKKLPKNNMIVEEDGPQLLKASGSVGSNYCEANDALSKRDFIYRMRVSRKEARESHYWLRMIDATVESNSETVRLIQEAMELRKIFSSIIIKAA